MASKLHRLRSAGGLYSLAREALHSEDGSCKMVIDYSSPNIAKQFHVGNLRSTLLGRYIDQVHRSLGYNVSAVNYLGDWGIQFALITCYWPQMRPSDQYWNSLSDVDKIKSLTDCYVIANRKAKEDEDFRESVRKTFMTMEKDLMASRLSEPMQLWTEIRELSERHLHTFYQLLGIHFDSWLCESDNVIRAHAIADQLISDSIAVQMDNGLSVVQHSNQESEYSIVKKSDGTSLYLSREIASILSRDSIFHADRYLFVVDRAQRKHFDALKIILERLGREDLSVKIEHVPYGRVKGLSTRLGRTEAVSDIVKSGTDEALSFMNNSKTMRVTAEEKEEVANQLSLSAVVFNDMKRARKSEYEFSFKNAFALNTNNALLLQMKHSRLHSIEEQNGHLLQYVQGCDMIPEGGEDVSLVMNMLENMSSVLYDSARKREPCVFTLELVKFAHCVGRVASQLQVKNQPNEIAVPRLLLLSACRNVLADGMRLLSIRPVDRM